MTALERRAWLDIVSAFYARSYHNREQLAAHLHTLGPYGAGLGDDLTCSRWYHELGRTKESAAEAERRAIAEAVTGSLQADNGVVAASAVRLRCKIAGLAPETISVPLDQVEKLLAAATEEVPRGGAARRRGRAAFRRDPGSAVGRHPRRTAHVRRALDKQTGEVVAPKHDKIRVVPLSPA